MSDDPGVDPVDNPVVDPSDDLMDEPLDDLPDSVASENSVDMTTEGFSDAQQNTEPSNSTSANSSKGTPENSTIVIPKENQSPRIKTYPESAKGPYIVYFRPIKKPLNIFQISKDLSLRFPSVTEIKKVEPNKLRIIVGERREANAIVQFQLFRLEYNVFIPSRKAEVDGVITEFGLDCDELLANVVGKFKNLRTRDVPILESTRFVSVSKI